MSSNLSSGVKNKNPNPRQRPTPPPQIRNKRSRATSFGSGNGAPASTPAPVPQATQFPATPPPAPAPTYPSDSTDPSTFMSPADNTAATADAPNTAPSFKQGGLVRRGYGKARGA